MFRKLFTFIFISLISCSFAVEPIYLQKKLEQGQVGDYIVTAQEGHLSLLLIRAQTETSFLLEEVTVPEKLVTLKGHSWQKWLQNKAPGHTSWSLFEIDRKQCRVTRCFSYSKNAWIYLTEEEQFFSKLLALPLSPLPLAARKKIGLAPSDGGLDTRPVWNPPVVIEGKKISKPTLEVFSTQWPEDSTPLARCTLELYFNGKDVNFAFPYWIEVKSPHYAFKIRTVDSGKGLKSPMRTALPALSN
jgi:hypothetical protein